MYGTSATTAWMNNSSKLKTMFSIGSLGFHGWPHCCVASSFSVAVGVLLPYRRYRPNRIAPGSSMGVYMAGPISPCALRYISGTAIVKALFVACRTYVFLTVVYIRRNSTLYVGVSLLCRVSP